MFFSRLYTQGWFSRDVHTGRLFLFACPSMVHLLSIYISPPAQCRQTKNRRYIHSLSHHACSDRWTGFLDSALPMLANTLTYKIKHCQRWQKGRLLKFCIVVFDKCPDFQNTALLEFYKIELSGDSALLFFSRMKIPEKLHCQSTWLFTQYELNQRIYITNWQCRFFEISSSVKIHWFLREQREKIAMLFFLMCPIPETVPETIIKN